MTQVTNWLGYLTSMKTVMRMAWVIIIHGDCALHMDVSC